MATTVVKPVVKGPTKSLRIMAWFYYVARKLDLKPTGYALENHLEADRVKQRSDRTINRSRKYDGYQHGKHMPKPDLVERIEISAPGSQSLIYHPFWEVAKPIEDTTELYIHLNKLKPGVRDLLFYPGTEPGKIPIRHRQDYPTTLEKLSKMADLDALTALIGLHQEDSLNSISSTPKFHVLYMKPLLTAFRRLIYYPPFPDIAHDLFEYLNTTIFYKTK